MHQSQSLCHCQCQSRFHTSRRRRQRQSSHVAVADRRRVCQHPFPSVLALIHPSSVSFWGAACCWCNQAVGMLLVHPGHASANGHMLG